MKQGYLKYFHPILIILLFCMIFSRLIFTYFPANGRLYLPEWNFATATVGRDLEAYVWRAAQDVRRGIYPITFGFGSTLIGFIASVLFPAAGICGSGQLSTCWHMFYTAIICLGVLGCIWTIHRIVQKPEKRIVSFLILAIFFLGVPMSKAIEAGNPDVFLAPWVACCLVTLRRLMKKKTCSLAGSVLFGISLGVLSNMKGFLLLFVIIALLFTPDMLKPAVFISFLAGFVTSALWPRFFGIPAGLFDIVTFSLRGSDMMSRSLYTAINYGNNAILPYVSNILQTLVGKRMSLDIHRMVTHVIGAIVFIMLYFTPWFSEIRGKHVRLTITSYSFALLCITLSYMAIITLPAWSYDYRLLYAVPVMFLLLDEARDTHTIFLVALSVITILIKSLWIPKDRIMSIFLYLHLYFMLRSAISLWVNTSQPPRHRKIQGRFV